MIESNEFNTILELIQAFPDEQSCLDHLEKLRWNGEVVSPFDESSKVYKCKGNKYRCRNTKKYFNVKTRTLFDNTRLPLQKWFIAIWMVTGHKKGISSIQLSKELGITQKSAWFMLQRIRECFGVGDDEKLDGPVEVDETYVGGKNKNRHANKKHFNPQGRNTVSKTPVMGMVQRGGKVIATVIKDVSSKTLTREIVNRVKQGAVVYTDEWKGYNKLKSYYLHSIVKHNLKEYVCGDTYTNTIEGFWSLLKRGIIGVYHYTSKKHLQKYVNEFVFRYNTRNISGCERFNELLKNSEHKLTYKELIHG